ncbi:MAG: S41 family peptidase [Opitutaceae bacterium]|nr:S41 family peptidase [Opitutaceae bacterium]
MATVRPMLNRFLAVMTTFMLGIVLALSVAHLGAAWRWWPARDVNRAADAVGEVMKTVNRYYVDENAVKPEDLRDAAIAAIGRKLDPYSGYMPLSEYQVLQEEMDGEFGGIGVQVERKDDAVVVIAPMPGGPGDRAGVLRGDRIVAIGDTRLDKPPMEDVIRQLRGKPGTEVAVTFFRPSDEKERTLRIKRERIHVDSVRDVHLIDDTGIGYIQITQFGEQTAGEFSAGLARLRDEGAKSLILDLRDNPGGLLDAAVAVVEPFFKKGELIVYTQGRNPEDRQEIHARSRREPFGLPVAVLINGGSASAAEIVTGALKDTDRAVVIGEKSFGKGSVQTIFNMRGGAGMRLTTARYYTPSGVTIHGVGIQPDIPIKMTPEEENAVRLQRLRPDVTDPAEFKKRFDLDFTEDRPLAAAVEELKKKMQS